MLEDKYIPGPSTKFNLLVEMVLEHSIRVGYSILIYHRLRLIKKLCAHVGPC